MIEHAIVFGPVATVVYWDEEGRHALRWQDGPELAVCDELASTLMAGNIEGQLLDPTRLVDADFPVVDVKVQLVDGKYHDVDSSALAFEIASRACLREALQLAKSVLLEPIMRVEVVARREARGPAEPGRRDQAHR